MENEPDIVDIADSNGEFDTLFAAATAAAVTYDQLAGQRLSVGTFNSANGHIDGPEGVKVGNATVTIADIIASHGVIHVIHTVLLP